MRQEKVFVVCEQHSNYEEDQVRSVLGVARTIEAATAIVERYRAQEAAELEARINDPSWGAVEYHRERLSMLRAPLGAWEERDGVMMVPLYTGSPYSDDQAVLEVHELHGSRDTEVSDNPITGCDCPGFSECTHARCGRCGRYYGAAVDTNCEDCEDDIRAVFGWGR